MTVARSPSQAQWESRYAADGYLYGTAPSPFLAACQPLLPARGRALSVADGEGRNGTFLAAAGLDVVSLDFSAAAQAKARALAAARGVSLTTVHADLLTWDWPDAAFDVVVGCFFQFLAPDERTLIFARLRAALKPGGWLLIEGFGLGQIHLTSGGPGKLENLYSRELLLEHFGDFVDLDIRDVDAVLDDGATHSGPAALVRLVGRKP